MTIEDIKKLDKEVLTPGDIAPVLHCDPNVIRYQASIDIKQLGFPCSKIGTRVKIPKQHLLTGFSVGEFNEWRKYIFTRSINMGYS